MRNGAYLYCKTVLYLYVGDEMPAGPEVCQVNQVNLARCQVNRLNLAKCQVEQELSPCPTELRQYENLEICNVFFLFAYRPSMATRRARRPTHSVNIMQEEVLEH